MGIHGQYVDGQRVGQLNGGDREVEAGERVGARATDQFSGAPRAGAMASCQSRPKKKNNHLQGRCASRGHEGPQARPREGARDQDHPVVSSAAL